MARAKEIAQSIADKNVPLSIDQMNRIYDVVLNMNSLNSKPADGKRSMPYLALDMQALLKEEQTRMRREME